MPVLNWDTKAPVDWRGSYLEQFMPANRGATAYAAALKKSVTVPESQATTTRTSSSPNTTAEERRTPEKDRHSNRTQRKPPKERNTPEKDKDANVSKKKRILRPEMERRVTKQSHMITTTPLQQATKVIQNHKEQVRANKNTMMMRVRLTMTITVRSKENVNH